MNVKKTRTLNQKFYEQPTLDVARLLLGKILIRNLNGIELAGMIVETEAYHETGDPACHAFRGKTSRNSVMFGPPGHVYVYFTYGMHFCMNVVTEKSGTAAAVLIRALQPLTGLETMKAFRGEKMKLENYCNGPAKLCQALLVDTKLNGFSLMDPPLRIVQGTEVSDDEVEISGRIGISKGTELPWRFYIKDNPFVSKSGPAVKSELKQKMSHQTERCNTSRALRTKAFKNTGR